jgi:protein TonB
MALHFDHGRWNKNSALFFKIGLALSIILCIILFQTEIVSAPISPPVEMAPMDIGIITPPPTVHKKKQVPPVKPPEPKKVIDNVVDDPEFAEPEPDIEPTEQSPERQNVSEDLLSFVSAEPKEDVILVPEISGPEDDKIYDFAERMPAFSDCLNSEDESVRRACTTKEILNIIYSKLDYPKLARQNGIEGMVLASFTVMKTGEISDIEIIRDIGGGCGQAVIKVLRTIPKMRPGKQNGKPVNVSFKVPVKFKLQ